MTVETHLDGEWVAAEPVEVNTVAGRVRLAGRHRRVRLAGSFHPLTAVAAAPRWTLETALAAPAPTLGRSSVASKPVSAYALLEDAQVTGDLEADAFFVLLETGDGAYRALGTAISAGDVLRVSVDPGSCRHVDDRARP